MKRSEFDIDYEYGRQGELLVGSLREAWLAGQVQVEVKRERYANGNLYVETRQQPGGRGEWVPSGLRTSTAELWVFEKPNGLMILAPRQLLVEAATRLHRAGVQRHATRHSSNPTQGYLMSIAGLCALSHPSGTQHP